MAAKTKQETNDQVKAFRKAAREIGCDDSEDRFKAALRTVAKAKLSEKGGKRHTAQRGKD